MVSCVICSRGSDISTEQKINIAQTIGVDYELIVIDNSHNAYTIFSAYNEGVRRAKGDIICFMHDDIVFHSKKWGLIVVEEYLNNPHLGLVGVIGCQFLSNKVQPWWTLGHQLGYIMQGHYNEEGVYITFRDGHRLKKDSAIGVVVDGLWFCIRKDLFNYISFDELTFSGFHCYDIDICLQILQIGYEVRVLKGIEIEHKSGGQVNDSYYEQLGKFVKKWGERLPISRGLCWGKIGTLIYQWYRNRNNR